MTQGFNSPYIRCPKIVPLVHVRCSETGQLGKAKHDYASGECWGCGFGPSRKIYPDRVMFPFVVRPLSGLRLWVRTSRPSQASPIGWNLFLFFCLFQERQPPIFLFFRDLKLVRSSIQTDLFSTHCR
jgi:hypothetical protein